MYSLLPAIAAALFFCFGLYVVLCKGFTRITGSFLILCLTTFFWQASWAVLFQAQNDDLALVLIKFGYLLIFFLPTSLYHFLTVITESENEMQYVRLSYLVAAVFGVLLLLTNLFLDGYYTYFWGYYPKAGILHPLHILQTAIVVSRGLFITYEAQKDRRAFMQTRLQLCFTSLCIYFFAAIDYLCNYGIEFYPPGVVFITLSLGIMASAILKYRLMDDPEALAASIAHEMRTPLSIIQMQAQAMDGYWSEVMRGYQLAVENGLCKADIRSEQLMRLKKMGHTIEAQVRKAQTLINLTLASGKTGFRDNYEYSVHSLQGCLHEALSAYPFQNADKELVNIRVDEDFEFFGSEILMTYLVYNLLKNAIYSIKQAGKGEIYINVEGGREWNRLFFTDTSMGISKDVLPHIFDDFFTTKQQGSGMGLAFCKRVMRSLNGRIECHSEIHQFTRFTLSFPHASRSEQDQLPLVNGRESWLLP